MEIRHTSLTSSTRRNVIQFGWHMTNVPSHSPSHGMLQSPSRSYAQRLPASGAVQTPAAATPPPRMHPHSQSPRFHQQQQQHQIHLLQMQQQQQQRSPSASAHHHHHRHSGHGSGTGAGSGSGAGTKSTSRRGVSPTMAELDDTEGR